VRDAAEQLPVLPELGRLEQVAHPLERGRGEPNVVEPAEHDCATDVTAGEVEQIDDAVVASLGVGAEVLPQGLEQRRFLIGVERVAHRLRQAAVQVLDEVGTLLAPRAAQGALRGHARQRRQLALAIFEVERGERLERFGRGQASERPDDAVALHVATTDRFVLAVLLLRSTRVANRLQAPLLLGEQPQLPRAAPAERVVFDLLVDQLLAD
jgi:hypothetical protein